MATTGKTKRPPTIQGGEGAANSFLPTALSRPAVLCLLLALATLAVYCRVGGYDFVNYDDSDYVTANRHVQAGLKWENVVWAFKTGHASNWHPLTWLSHELDCQLFGVSAGPQHLVNLGLHVVNMLLLFLVLWQMTRAYWRSAVVAGLFALHPLHVESVAWISERKDVLSTLFFLLTLWAYARYAVCDRQGTTLDAGAENQSRKASGFYVLALVFYVLGLMSKPMLVTLPCVLLLLDYWPLGRIELSFKCWKARLGLKLLLEKLPFFALSAASSVITFIAQQKGGAVSTSLPVADRVANALVSYVRYIGKMFLPVDLSVLYPHPGHWPVGVTLGCALLLGIISFGVLFLGRRWRFLPVGWLWFVGMMVPVIGLVQVGIQAMADRYTYVPMIGLFIVLVWGLGESFPGNPERKKWLGTGAVLSLLGCGLVTARQAQYWRDSEALFQHAVDTTSDNYLAYNNLGFYYSGKGQIDKAMENYRKSIAIKPTYEDALNNLGYALAGRKQFLEAIPYYKAALRSAPRQVEVHNNLGNALSELGRIDEAIAHYEVALGQDPEHADAHNNLGIALAMQGKLEEAINHFQQAIRFKANYASAHGNLGNAYAVQHRLPEAMAQYQECLRLNPKDAQAHNNLGNVLMEQGKLAEAISHYNEALELNENNPEAHFNLGVALVRQGQREQAASHFAAALRLKPDYQQAKRQLELLSGGGKTTGGQR